MTNTDEGVTWLDARREGNYGLEWRRSKEEELLDWNVFWLVDKSEEVIPAEEWHEQIHGIEEVQDCFVQEWICLEWMVNIQDGWHYKTRNLSVERGSSFSRTGLEAGIVTQKVDYLFRSVGEKHFIFYFALNDSCLPIDIRMWARERD